MKKVLFATGNPSKALRFSKGLQKKGILDCLNEAQLLWYLDL